MEVVVANLKKKLMFRFGIFYLLLVFAKTSTAQNTIEKTLERYNSGSVSYINADKLKLRLENNDSLILLDTRSLEEYNISHLKNAIWVGYKTFEESKVNNIDKDAEVIVYCSVGVRSEKIGEELQSLGYKKVYNLYGGIFLWVNKGFPIYRKEHLTNKIHSYNKKWAEYITNGIIIN
jgi:rhodanese-related sulfurtransferase